VVFAAPSRARINGIAFGPGGRYLAAACDHGKYQVWDLKRLRQAVAALGLD
jgi:WD40 repeat protein